ncbi:MAG: SagB/ThcOx family dehydrogenase [Promethearchaeota archaeon]
MENEITKNRKFLLYPDKKEYIDIVPKSDEEKKLPFPLFQKPYPSDAPLIDLPSPKNFKIGNLPFLDLVNSRVSRRRYSKESLSLEELSFLLWCTQGVKEVPKNRAAVLRTVPSSGAKSPFETYLFINRVEGLTSGIYRFIAFEHKLLFMKTVENQEERIVELLYGQSWGGTGAVMFCWVAVPYRTEWRYTVTAHKAIALDMGIVAQNLYMAAEALKLGTCSIGCYEQTKIDVLLELDSTQEMTMLVQPLGKVAAPVRLKDFFEKKKSPVTEVDLQKLVGQYLVMGSIEVEVKLIDGKLIIINPDDQIEIHPRNPTEFLGSSYFRAVKCVNNENGSVIKLVVLMQGDMIYDLIKQ